MAKAAKTAIKTKDARAAAEAKNWTKVIKAVRSPKTGAYTFKESIVHKENIKNFLAQTAGAAVGVGGHNLVSEAT